MRPNTISVDEPYSHTIGFQLTAASYRNESDGERWRKGKRAIGESERKRDEDSATRGMMKHFTI